MTTDRVSRSNHAPELDDRAGEIRFGLIVLSTDLTSEGDLYRLLPLDTVSIHVSRVAYENPTTPENLRKMTPRLAEAADLIAPGEDLRAICYSCTAASVTIGDAEITTAINRARPDVPVVTPTLAARHALSALRARRIAMLTPYLEKTAAPMVDYFTRHGFTVTNAHCFGLEDDRDMARISVSTIVDAAVAVDTDDADALFVSCTALKAVGAIAEIEARTGKPVVTSNQACAWVLSRLGGLQDHRPPGCGRLFEQPLTNFHNGEAA
ncbi:ectoine utilization protein EutA [Nitratireductor sp. XY-223]|uniref:aspartate racemase/maleate isomerase family protein n=1 Tax=Nitratireductor sp. XY-223 TaxID=2561926 RepID=UPI0010AA165E|nr:ectoine utilization protein EutA [Nitratireductor sp. XY-223]